MTIDLKLLKKAVLGCAKLEEKENRLYLYRFTDEQAEAYKNCSNDFYKKSKATANVKLEFTTNSQNLRISGECFSGSSRNFFGFDVYVNGSLVYHAFEYLHDGFSSYTIDTSLGDADIKNVTVYFPWSVQANVGSLTLDDGASFDVIKRPHKMICFGDSITHGYDAKNPSFTYANRLADALRAESLNKGIGGDKFFPTLADLKDDFEPDYITVAYGTNDWGYSSKEIFDLNSRLFYQKLSKNYPNTKIFALSPIWRGNWDSKEKQVGEFSYVANTIKNISDSLPNVIFINCFDFVPHEKEYFSPDILHPNDAGSYHYAAELYAEIKKYL